MTECGAGLPRTPLDLPLDRSGTVLVEASAGTGKTHALTTLIARLVVEHGRAIDEILVVTFTRAATAELRDRIRRTLKAAQEAVRASLEERCMEAEPQARELLARWARPAGTDLAPAARRLDAALQDIDRASVYTIHGFCQRVLGDLAFEGAFPFGFEVSGDDAEVTAGAVRDFWRRRLYDAPLVLVRYAVEKKFLPGALAEWAAAGRTKPGLHIAGGEAPAKPPEACEAEWRAAFETACECWESHGEAFRTEMREGEWLKRNRYRLAKVEERLAFVEAAFAAPEPRLWEVDVAGWFGRTSVSEACKKNAGLPGNPLFDAFDALEEASGRLRAAFDAWLRWARGELIAEVRAAARRRARENRRLRYDDLLIEVEAALRSEGGGRLARKIRRAHPCALIDEYQDTDQVQARIFARVYGVAGGAPDDAAEPDGRGEAGGERHASAAAPETSGDLEDGAPAEPLHPEGELAAGFEGEPGASLEGRRRARDGARASLFVVGDPKQSIYRFRGADIYAYLGTRHGAGRVLALDRNWRSVPGLVAAVNAVFAAPLPFALPEIEYRAVSAARDGGGPLRVAGEDGGRPFALRLLPPGEYGRPWKKGDAYPAAAEAAANEIARLLGADGESAAGGTPRGATLDGEPLRGSDIAVLVRTRHQGQLVAQALRERGVRAAEVGDDNIFDTREAEHLERLLRGLAEPVPEAELRGALAGDLFALDTPELRAMDEDDEAWSGWRERLRAWRSDWETRGIGALLLRLLEHEGGAERLLRHRDGARRLTNYRHLAELLLEAEAGSRLGPAGLAAWLGRRRQAGERGRDENVLLRLDSDEQLVRILTVHGSKGLEFPVVFCPFAWHVQDPKRGASDPDAAYHERAGDGYREVLDLDPDGAARGAARLEEFSESLRLLYVALTRAKYRCVVTWGQVRDAERSPLAWLLHRVPEERAGARAGSGKDDAEGAEAGIHERQEVPGSSVRAEEGSGGGSGSVAAPLGAVEALDALAERFSGLAWNAWREEVEGLAKRCPEGISVSVLDPDEAPATRPAEPRVPALAPRRALRPLRRIRQMTSFSALSAERTHAAGASAHALVERPDHDARDMPSPRPDESGEGPSADEDARSAFTFPRGMTAGSCLHRIFERLDQAPAGGPAPDLDAVCRDALLEFGFGDEWRPVARTMVERTRAVRLHEPGGEGAEGFRLADPVPRVAEMEFHFPVSGLVRDRLAACLVEHGYPDPFGEGAGGGEAGDPPPIEGFLRGFIDLTVEHGGRWYLLDYKSNWLGPAPADYAPAALASATHASGYPLQYLIYLVALHRHLGARLPGYDYERHAGGVFYLYLRGIDPAAGMSRGVYFDRPPRACIEALDACFRGGGPA